MRLKWLCIIACFWLLVMSQTGYALNGGHWVFKGNNSDVGRSVILSPSHEGDNPSGRAATSNTVTFEAPDKFQWDNDCLILTGNLLYSNINVNGQQIWYFDASHITNPAHNDSDSGVWHDKDNPEGWTLSGTLTVQNICDNPKDFDIERDMNVGGNYQAIIVKGSIGAIASCTLSLDSPTVALGSIGVSELRSASVGDRLPLSEDTVLTVTCNKSAYKLTFIPESVGGDCIGTDNGVLRYCIDAQGKRLDFSSGVATYSGLSADNSGGVRTILKITGARGTSTPSAGTSSARVNITVEPE
ncbi:hypothetical protein AAAL58_001212 [Salmonella enterica]